MPVLEAFSLGDIAASNQYTFTVEQKTADQGEVGLGAASAEETLVSIAYARTRRKLAYILKEM